MRSSVSGINKTKEFRCIVNYHKTNRYYKQHFSKNLILRCQSSRFITVTGNAPSETIKQIKLIVVDLGARRAEVGPLPLSLAWVTLKCRLIFDKIFLSKK